MKIKDTLTGKKIELEKKGVKKLFVCGPTVYDYSHIGHARTYLAFDIIVRYLKHIGFKVRYIQNITDVDDKIIGRARENEESPSDLARRFEKEYLRDVKDLKIESVDRYVRATEVIPEIIFQIETLEKKGFAYKTESGVYFKVREFKEYGKLSKQNIDALESGSRIEPGEEKEDPLDFALWKLPKDKGDFNKGKGPIVINGEPLWPSPWGWGRPGWHIEDTAISEKYFGPQYDIHGGAEDLKFPHHESEIAQQEAASGKKPFVKIWMHTGFLTINGKKMGKSLKNFTTIREFLKDHSPEILRFMVLSHHYRSPVDYTPKSIKETEGVLKNLEDFMGKLLFVSKNSRSGKKVSLEEEIKETENSFREAMKDDFNTPKALGLIFKLVKSSETKIWDLSRRDALKLKNFLTETFKTFGFDLKTPKIPRKIRSLSREREKSRGNKQFIHADLLRKKIHELGYEAEDTPLGPFIKPKS